MQKRLIRKLDLEILLSKVEPLSKPSTELEQYAVSTETAATMLYLAAYMHDNVLNKKVVDLGCGTGRLALGAAFLGAREVVGIDIDKHSIKRASENSIKVLQKKKVQWIISDIESIRGHFDTVLQNPPFGVQKRGADRKFIVKALQLGSVVYSLHKRPDHDSELVKKLKSTGDGILQVAGTGFMNNLVEENGGIVDSVYALLMTIPHMFPFHTEKRHEFVVDLYVLRKK